MATAPDCGLFAAALETVKNAGPVLAAIAAASVAIIGWMIKGLVDLATWHYGERQQRIDLMTAILSEIEYNLVGESNYAGEDNLKGLLAVFDRPTGMRESFLPYAATTTAPPLLATLTEKFMLLPPRVSSAVFKYFNSSDALNAQIKDFRSDTFKAIGRVRQKAVIEDVYNKLGAGTVAAGTQSIDALRASIKWQIFRRNSVVCLAITLFAAAAMLLYLGLPKWVKPLERVAAVWASTCGKPFMSFVP